MKRHQLHSALFLVLFLTFVTTIFAQDLPVGKPEELGFSQERLQRLTNVFQSYANDKKMAGSVVLVMRHGKVA
ncbi:MAG: hypothetical protein MUF39_10860, partial [Cyclobacteriaceae bacterium]|nr:hypothetical protein [Cyclobacteriaceae bacterium]